MKLSQKYGNENLPEIVVAHSTPLQISLLNPLHLSSSSVSAMLWGFWNFTTHLLLDADAALQNLTKVTVFGPAFQVMFLVSLRSQISGFNSPDFHLKFLPCPTTENEHPAPPEKWWESSSRKTSFSTSFWDKTFSHKKDSALEIGETSHPNSVLPKLQGTLRICKSDKRIASTDCWVVHRNAIKNASRETKTTSWESKGTSTSPMPPLPRSKNGSLICCANFKL